MFCTTCYGHPKDCDCGTLQPKPASTKVTVIHCHQSTTKKPVEPKFDPGCSKSGCSTPHDEYLQCKHPQCKHTLRRQREQA